MLTGCSGMPAIRASMDIAQRAELLLGRGVDGDRRWSAGSGASSLDPAPEPILQEGGHLRPLVSQIPRLARVRSKVVELDLAAPHDPPVAGVGHPDELVALGRDGSLVVDGVARLREGVGPA